MKKMLLIMMLILMVGVNGALADSLTINSITPGIGYTGQVNATVNDDGNIYDTYGYCLEQKTHSYLGTAYPGEIRELTDGQLWQAQLFYDAYHNSDGSSRTPTDTQAEALQLAIWGPSPGPISVDAVLLRSLYDWADIPDVAGWGQDFILAKTNSVPEPSTLLMLGFGLIGASFATRKFKK
jgi:hypothetical protein